MEPRGAAPTGFAGRRLGLYSRDEEGESMIIEGRVIKRRIAVGTKSEHDAVMLSTESGDYVLRRQGGNAFRDPELDRLVGETVSCDGVIHGHTLLVSRCDTLPADKTC